jgi:hypothetical protein
MSREVCVLDRVRAGLYVKDGVIPDCQFHHHVKRAEADALVGANDGQAYARRLPVQRDPVTGYFDRKERIVMFPSMILRPQEGVVCLVRGVIQGHSTGVRSRFATVRGKGMKYPVPASGARGRYTSARQINHVPPAGETEQATQ